MCNPKVADLYHGQVHGSMFIIVATLEAGKKTPWPIDRVLCGFSLSDPSVHRLVRLGFVEIYFVGFLSREFMRVHSCDFTITE